MSAVHVPVLLDEVIAGLAIKADGAYIDATFGRGGHSEKILEHLGPSGRLLAVDKDPAALLSGEQRFGNDARFRMKQASFAEIENLIKELDWLGRVDGVLLDLGVSSPQLDDPTRGFSFTKEGPLDMRMNPNFGISAAEWLQTASVDEMTHVLREYGEERFARRIAKAIVHSREQHSITTTSELANIIAAVVPKVEQRIHPATRSFQAIRIYINQELADLQACLPQCLKVLAQGGRLCVISFHSLEDRIVKQFIQGQVSGPAMPRGLPIKAIHQQATMRKVGKLVRPSVNEINMNPRARSAKLRIAEKIT